MRRVYVCSIYLVETHFSSWLVLEMPVINDVHHSLFSTKEGPSLRRGSIQYIFAGTLLRQQEVLRSCFLSSPAASASEGQQAEQVAQCHRVPWLIHHFCRALILCKMTS